MNPSEIRWALEHPELLVGIVEAAGIQMQPSSEALRRQIDDALRARQAEGPMRDELRVGIRKLLRFGGFKPSGRSKPASEYLALAALRGDFPFINAVVDINNLISLETGWPCSVLDRDQVFEPARGLELRFGRPGESFVFNASGQTIRVEGLLGLYLSGGSSGAGLGNPVKDSMRAKTTEQTSAALALVYTSRALATPEALDSTLERYEALLQRHAGASETTRRIYGA